MLTFEPVAPRETAGFSLQRLEVHVRDHKRRELAAGDRTLEAHYGGFVLSQARARSREDARLRALETSYGQVGRAVRVAGP